ncbi:FAD-dependent oxidoreductase [Nafulsella turpanensis]|uniref:FAD-dependent oxidoreductase n=1 Tax=Nafulsella turpanensis TaxID=1265690 RepID=UPI00034967D3|nr:FAD-dependent oxidoreductase [Nafulsella turpanensis]
MKLPYIIAVDDDQQVLESVTRDLRSEYGEKYRIISTTDPQEALDALGDIKNKKETVALFVADQRMPEMDGVEFLGKALKKFPEARRVLLTAYSDTEAAIKAINDVQLDYYFVKPWDPPEEKLYPVLEGLLADWQATHTQEFEGIKVIGYQFSPRSHEIKNFLASNLIPYQWLDMQSHKAAGELQEEYECSEQDLPLIIFEDGSALCNPDLQELARKIGLQLNASESLYDVVIIGAGPAGLAAAVYGGSEGLRTLVVEKHSPGGQAGSSSRIENYLGFPRGVSGAELTRRALSQVSRFGVEILAPQEVKDVEIKGNYKLITLSDETVVKTRSIIIATGVNYRKLKVDGLNGFNGAGIYYGGSMAEAPMCRQKNIFIVGGGNSAGQAAMYLSQYARKVVILIRKENLGSSMSRYLIDQIEGTPNIEVWGNTEVEGALGEEKLEGLKLVNNQEDRHWTEEEVGALFIFIGAKPCTHWLPFNIITNKKGYIETGRDLVRYPDYSKFWKLKREPYLLETCGAGIFAAGDVRAGAMNRVASAVGEGAMAIKFVHQYLAEN